MPDVYARNQQLEERVERLRTELKHSQDVSKKASATWDQFRKERDFHRMHHKRVLQEKQKLVVDIKRLKRHYEQYEPALRELKDKYELAMKEKMLARLGRERAEARSKRLQAQVQSLRQAAGEMDLGAGKGAGSRGAAGGKSAGAGRGSGAATASSATATAPGRRGPDSKLPGVDQENPFLSVVFDPPEVRGFRHLRSLEGHEDAVSCLAFHPTKPVCATGSDDGTWRMWALEDGEEIMSGSGHRDWVAGVDFHPRGTHLATCAGDGVVKVWDFLSARCALTLTDHP